MTAKHISMQPLKSSSIAKIGYDSVSQTLAVEFKDGGGTYHYSGVESGTLDKLKNAESAGRYLQANVVGKYPHKKV